MGLITSSFRMMYLTAYVLEKKLDLQMQEYQNRLDMVKAELQSCKGAVDSNIQRSFSYQF